MAIGDFLEKVKAGSNAVSKIIPGKESDRTLLELRKKQKEFVEEKAKLYSYLGMEVYDLHTAGTVLPPQTMDFCRQLDSISEAVDALNKEIEEMEVKAERSSVCECGAKLPKTSRFCPLCGKPTDFVPSVCLCGARIGKGEKFCKSCGQVIVSAAKTNDVAPAPVVQCVCGASVEAGQPMCMSCGRRVPV